MFGNFFRGMYFGKGNRPDFSPEDLPSNRWALFFEMLRIRWGKLVQLNLLYVLFMLPLLLWTLIHFTAMNEAAAMMLESAMPLEEQILQMQSWLYMWLLVNIPLSLVSGLALPGLAIVCRNWARDQHAWIGSDFFGAIKANWKQALAVSLFMSVCTFLLIFAFIQYPYIVGSGLVSTFMRSLVVVFLAVLWLSQILLWPMMVTYELKFTTLARNSVMLTIGRLPFVLAVGVGLLLPLALLLLTFSGIVLLIVVVFYLFFGLSFSMFVGASYANSVFDRFINPRIAGAPVNQGLAPKEYDPEDQFDPDVWNQFDDTKGSGNP